MSPVSFGALIHARINSKGTVACGSPRLPCFIFHDAITVESTIRCTEHSSKVTEKSLGGYVSRILRVVGIAMVDGTDSLFILIAL